FSDDGLDRIPNDVGGGVDNPLHHLLQGERGRVGRRGGRGRRRGFAPRDDQQAQRQQSQYLLHVFPPVARGWRNHTSYTAQAPLRCVEPLYAAASLSPPSSCVR